LGVIDEVQFRRDDFDEVNERYFAALRSGSEPFTDPSGWIETYSEAAALLPEIVIPSADLGRYYLDEGDTLGATKDKILSLVSAWENRIIVSRELTLCHSVSAGTFLILVVLRRRGVRTIVFETPGYAVTMNQAEYLGFSTVLIPSYRADNFQTTIVDRVPRSRPCAVWITQPRMSLGINQRVDEVKQIVNNLGAEGYLIVDEATEQEFPSLLRAAEIGSHPNLIRIRGITKSMGLNGLRLAFILHDASARDDFESGQEVVGGSLDLFSLRAAALLAGDIPRFQMMLAAARHQTTFLRARAAKLAAGSPIAISPLVNGYMGSAWITFPEPSRYEEYRARLLAFCQERRTAVILAASMRFAFDPSFEAVRINYFSRERHVLDGVKTLVEFAASLREPD